MLAGEYNRVIYNREYNFFIDDGNYTDLSQKGDGVKSVVTLALLNNIKNNVSSRLIAIEEPESHLHPEVIHKLNQVLREISENSTVLITTHNPIFINRDNISNNFIIENPKLSKAINIAEIKELLGSQMSDNLYFARNIVLVEGPYDQKIFTHVLANYNEKIKLALDNKKLMFFLITGVKNLKSYLKLFNSLLINTIVIVDNDKAATNAVNEALQMKLIEHDNVIKLICGKNESEFEDLLKKDFYLKYVRNDDLIKKELKKYIDCKWSEKYSKAYQNIGNVWNDDLEQSIKENITNDILKVN